MHRVCYIFGKWGLSAQGACSRCKKAPNKEKNKIVSVTWLPVYLREPSGRGVNLLKSGAMTTG